MKVRALLLALLLIPTLSFGAEFNAGFVQGLWYSADEVFAGKPVRVYVALRNNTTHDLTGTVTFTDNGSRIGTASISALPGRLVEAWTDWNPTRGEHELRATLSNIQIHEIGGNTKRIEVVSDLAEDVLIVDIDTDEDGIGDTNDTDDDNDGFTDEEEQNQNTDPLDPTSLPKETEVEEETINEDHTEAFSEKEETNTSASESSGLERFFDDSTRIDTFLAGFTEKIEETKTSLDTYRAERNLARSRGTGTSTEDRGNKEDIQGSSSSSSPTNEQATITRSRIEAEKPGIMSRMSSAIHDLFAGLYTFLLFLFSKLLAYPAIIELLFLLTVIIVVFRIARRFGRRPIDR